MKYLSLFSGIGGFELGITQAYEEKFGGLRSAPPEFVGAQGELTLNGVRSLSPSKNENNTYKQIGESDNKGHISCVESGCEPQLPTCIGYSEIDKYAVQIYQKHFPEHKNYGDITKINEEELPEFDLLVGGFPCQAFSIAGKRGGFADTRGTLFFDIARIAKAKQPMFMLLENVKGLVSHDKGKTLEVILESLQELGYYVNHEIRNSKDYNVPQNRERIFFTCKHIKLLSSVGQSEKTSTSESIIQEWLFQLLLNNLAEVKKLQEHASKDWVVGYLLLKEISQNPEWNAENILDGISIPTGEESSLFEVNPWQNIDMWLSKNLGESSSEVNKSTISTAISSIIESKTYTFSTMLKAILLATVLLRESSKSLWNETLLSLIVIQEGTKYARINNQGEEVVITESGITHIASELQEFAGRFFIQHLRGTSRPEVFPIRGDDPEDTQTSIPSPQGAKGIATRHLDRNGGLISNEASTIQVAEVPHVLTNIESSQQEGNKPDDSNVIRRATYSDDMRIRRLTPTECARLQGFPDHWHKVEGISDTQAYKCYGNAVTVNVIKEILLTLLKNERC